MTQNRMPASWKSETKPQKDISQHHLRASEVTHCTTHQKCHSFHRRYGSRCSATAAQLLACSPYPHADAERGRCYWPQRGNHPAKRLVGGSQQIHQRVSILVVGIWKHILRLYYIETELLAYVNVWSHSRDGYRIKSLPGFQDVNTGIKFYRFPVNFS